jgi:hypothetical protein
MDGSEYAEHKGVKLLENPTRRHGTMKRPKSRTELQAELENANNYIEETETKLDRIAGIATGDEDGDEDNRGPERARHQEPRNPRSQDSTTIGPELSRQGRNGSQGVLLRVPAPPRRHGNAGLG